MSDKNLHVSGDDARLLMAYLAVHPAVKLYILLHHLNLVQPQEIKNDEQ